MPYFWPIKEAERERTARVIEAAVPNASIVVLPTYDPEKTSNEAVSYNLDNIVFPFVADRNREVSVKGKLEHLRQNLNKSRNSENLHYGGLLIEYLLGKKKPHGKDPQTASGALIGATRS